MVKKGTFVRISMPILMLGCAIAAPLFSQTEKDADPVSYQERELKACGPKEKQVMYSAATDKTTHPTGERNADKALVYVLRPSTAIGNHLQTKLAVDGEWKGVNRADNYFFFTLQPGMHYFCSQAHNRSIVVLTVEAGKTYYLEQSAHFIGANRVNNDLGVMDDTEGQKELAKAHPSTWEIK